MHTLSKVEQALFLKTLSDWLLFETSAEHYLLILIWDQRSRFSLVWNPTQSYKGRALIQMRARNIIKLN